MVRRSVILLWVSVICAGSGAEKVHDWQTGTVLDTERNRYFVGVSRSSSTNRNVSATGTSTTNGETTNSDVNGTYSGHTTGSDRAEYAVFENYVIDSGTVVYLVELRLHFRWSKGAHLTVNGPVKFYLDKRRMHILDDDGKDHEASIVKQTLKK
jgi:hypothetical protein